jgi:type IV pilus assembly protein PilM
MQLKKILQNIKPKAKGLLGIDITANAIRLVKLSCFGSNYQVEVCVNITLDLHPSDDLIIATLKKALKQAQCSAKNAAVALAHSAIIFKEIKIASGLSDKEIEAFLQFNIEKYIGESANSISFDYQIIKTPIKTADYVILRLITVRRERVEKCIKLLCAADLCPKIVDIDSYALERAIRRQFREIAGLIAIINIDVGAILIVVIDAKQIVYAHEDFMHAEDMQSVAQIIMQLKLKLQLAVAALHQPLEKIVLSGEKALLPKLRDAVNDQFNVQTIIADPFFGMKLSSAVSQNIMPVMSIGCGLALRVADGSWN